jgi:hypothetical protein
MSKNVQSVDVNFSSKPSSNRHGRKQPYTAKYDDLHVIVLRSYISVPFTDAVLTWEATIDRIL